MKPDTRQQLQERRVGVGDTSFTCGDQWDLLPFAAIHFILDSSSAFQVYDATREGGIRRALPNKMHQQILSIPSLTLCTNSLNPWRSLYMVISSNIRIINIIKLLMNLFRLLEMPRMGKPFYIFLGQGVEILKGLADPSMPMQHLFKTEDWFPPYSPNGKRKQEQSPTPSFPSSLLQLGLVEHAAETCCIPLRVVAVNRLFSNTRNSHVLKCRS